MKKAFLLLGILCISVMTTACINNFAVQELNNKAKIFMEQGDYSSAIERLKSGIDLDPSVFESHYNLAVAYTKAEDYLNAIKAYNDAIKLKPEFADSYYSLAVCEENLAQDIINTDVKIDENGNIVKNGSIDNNATAGDKKLSEDDYNYIIELLKSSIKHYQTYLEKSSSPPDKEDVIAQTDELNKRIEELGKKEAE